MSSRWTGFFIWALVAASAAFWGIKVFAATRAVPPGAQAPQVATSNGPMERLFGAVVVPTVATAAAPPESSRYQLVGVIAPPNGVAQGGYAVIAVDGQPAHAWHVGATIDGNTSLLSVSKRGAEFGPPGGPSSFSLQLPEPASAETGTLAPAVSQPDPAQLQQGSPQRENASHVAQPPFPARGGFPGAAPGRNGPQTVGRSAYQQGQPGVPVGPHVSNSTPTAPPQGDNGAPPPQQQ
jgi:general secretion pathway protein C